MEEEKMSIPKYGVWNSWNESSVMHSIGLPIAAEVLAGLLGKSSLVTTSYWRRTERCYHDESTHERVFNLRYCFETPNGFYAVYLRLDKVSTAIQWKLRSGKVLKGSDHSEFIAEISDSSAWDDCVASSKVEVFNGMRAPATIYYTCSIEGVGALS